jgi:hypothetical protein
MALLLGAGMSLSFAQASAMAAKMAIAAEMAMPGPDGCDGCNGDDPDDADLNCLAVCGAAVHGLLPADPTEPPRTSRTGLHSTYLVLDGRTNTPDHGPPKILILG